MTFVRLSDYTDEEGKPYYIFKGKVGEMEYHQELVETEFKLIEEGENSK